MAVIKLNLSVANLDAVRAVFDVIKVYRSTTGAAGPYVEVTTPSTRIALTAGKVVYGFTDSAGLDTYYYRCSYFNSVSTLESSLSDPQQGQNDAALAVMTVEELKTIYLFGIDLTDEANRPFPDSMFEFYIKASVSWLETQLDIAIRPTLILDEGHDYYPEDYVRDGFFKLTTKPILSIEKMTLVLGGNVQTTYDLDWLQVEKDMGHVHVIPTGSGGIIPGTAQPLLRRGFYPRAFRFDYTAGFEAGKVPDDIRQVIGLVASYGPLNISGDLVGGAGLAAASLSIDGLSQSITTSNSSTNAGFGARLLEYAKQVKMLLPSLKGAYKGIPLAVV